MLFVDVDNMKAINNRYGHESGDEAIRAVAEALRQELRSADTVARIGGDGFAALALGLQEAELRSVEQRIRDRLRRVEMDGDVHRKRRAAVRCLPLGSWIASV
jgi:diguanylate cyclase (GGDEF)-like protein